MEDVRTQKEGMLYSFYTALFLTGIFASTRVSAYLTGID